MAEHAAALLYNMERTQKGRQIKFILIQMNVHIKNIHPDQYHIPLGVLSGAVKSPETPFPPCTEEGFPEEMLVMKGFSSAMLDEFLSRMRKAGISRIDLKAVLTPANLNWDSLTLYEELKKEHAAMQSANSRAQN